MRSTGTNASITVTNIARQHAPIKAELLEAVGAVIDRGEFILGDEVRRFEQRFADLCGVRFAVAVHSGTDALILALRALNIGEGDDVVTVPNSFVASTACVMLVGARPLFVDVGDDYNMDPALLDRAITSRTKAILPVHLTGRPAKMPAVLSVAQRYGLPVVEDCAQGVLAECHGRRVGSFGAMGCFSLHPLKTLGACGDGGVLTTDDAQLCERVRVLRNHGLRTRDACDTWSSHSRLDTLQAAILLVKLKYLQSWTDKRRANALFYQQALAGTAGVKVPRDQPYEKAVYHTFVIQAERRDDLKRHLAAHGIETAIHYPIPIHLQRAAVDLGYAPGSLPVAERQAQRILSLPVHSDLTTGDLHAVAETIRDFYVG